MSTVSAALGQEENQFNLSHESLLDKGALENAIQSGSPPVPLFKDALARADQQLNDAYLRNDNITEIVQGRAWVVDHILIEVWKLAGLADKPGDVSLLAVGGYGRGELLPHSDIDLLILTRSNRHSRFKAPIQTFLTTLWDIGLEIGQSVRSPSQCKQEASKDITVATTLMESRTLTGDDKLRQKMEDLTSARRIWPIKKFLRAKWDEQLARHDKYYDVDYALEPNVKTSPGGLRDIQTIMWVAKRQYGADSLSDLVRLGFLRKSEEAMVSKGQKFLWKLRYGLHYLEGRREDRLLFDKQRELARLFGYEDDEASLGVEKLMKQYYRTVANLRALNDVLLQHLDEAILRAGERKRIEPLNRRFQASNGYIETTSPEVFQRSPYALMEMFVLMAQNPGIEGVRASTIREIRDSRRLIDEDFRNDISNVSLFMELLKSPHKLTLQLRRMARYGILGRYLPEFGQITGQMQHDLFHIYTVDAHTLQVVENMRRFLLPGAEDKFPVAAEVARNLPKPELLYIAGLYHDIAKGRGGDHSELGKADAQAFCERHHLSAWDTKLVIWLVEKHLLMSMTAQRKDIDDPQIIHEFAVLMGDKLHLDYLYAMTVADICATNPELWNSWRAALLKQLYLNTRRALRLGLENPLDRDDRILDRKSSALELLQQRGISEQQASKVWEIADDEYFLRESPRNIAWHTEAIAGHSGDAPLVSMCEMDPGDSTDGATQIFIHARNSAFLFARCTAALQKLQLNIVSARIFTSAKDYCMDTFTVLESSGRPVGDNKSRLAQIEKALVDSLGSEKLPSPVGGFHRTRKQRYFGDNVSTTVLNSADKPYTTLEINCPDHPGILACVGKIFADNGISLKDARITTLGERVEDLFFITDSDGKAIHDEAVLEDLQQQIQTELQSRLGH